MKRLRLSAVPAVFVAALFMVGVCGCGPTQQELGNAVISKIEQFRRATGRLPASLLEAGIEGDKNCPCYCKTGENSYIVWYVTMLGKSDTYDSQTKDWLEARRPFCRVF